MLITTVRNRHGVGRLEDAITALRHSAITRINHQ